MCTDNICISYAYKDFEKIEAGLKEISSISYGFIEKKFNLQFAVFTKQNVFFFSKPRALLELNIYLAVHLTDTSILA